MEYYGKLYGPIESKYLDRGPSIAVLERTLGDVEYRLG